LATLFNPRFLSYNAGVSPSGRSGFFSDAAWNRAQRPESVCDRFRGDLDKIVELLADRRVSDPVVGTKQFPALAPRRWAGIIASSIIRLSQALF
jgi:hypothetical protein